MKTTQEFLSDGARYQFDFGECSYQNGYCQLDSTEDAWYYGHWSNPDELKIVGYIEGDVYRHQFDNLEELIEWLQEFKDSGYFKGIDPGLDPKMAHKFFNLGLNEYVHKECRVSVVVE